MGKKLFSACLIGAAAGIALETLTAIVLSLWLRLGYYLPYPAALPEQVGGEMNAVLLQTAVSALLGAGVGAALRLARWKPWPAGKRTLWASAAFGLALLASVGLFLAFQR